MKIAIIIGAVILFSALCVIGFFLLRRTLYNMIDRRIERFQSELIEKQVREIQNMYRQVRGWRHDYRNHINNMKIQLSQRVYSFLFSIVIAFSIAGCNNSSVLQSDSTKIYVSELQTISESQTSETIVSFDDSVESDEYITIQGNRIEKGCKELSLYTVDAFEYQVYDNTIQLDSPLSADDIEKLAQLSELKSLCCSSCGIEDISFLENLTCIEFLDLRGNKISDISVLSELTNLKELILSSNPVSDVSCLQALEKLRYLNLSYTRFEDVSIMSDFEHLKSLDISCNEILNIEELGSLNNLTRLSVSKTGIDNLEFIKNMDHLTYLAATLNNIKDISILSDKATLEYLYLDGNPIEDYSQLDNLNLVDCDLG